MKPIVDCTDAWLISIVGGQRLACKPINHPNPHGLVSNERQVVSSSIISVDGNRVETQNTVYNVLNWMN